MHESILIIEDDTTLRVTVSGFLARLGYRISEAEDGIRGFELASRQRFALILLDLRLPDIDGMQVLEKLREQGCDALVIIITAFPDLKSAVGAMRAGAYDYIQKPFELEDLRESIRRALETRSLRHEVAWRRAGQAVCTDGALIGESPAFLALLEMTRRVAQAGRVPVLLRGESGTGKECIARTIHCRSDRADGPWITLNCSALPEGLLESELFGFEKGAFTDARQAKQGLLELADGGTLFLDEIGDLAPALQPKLLRVLETRKFRRLGGTREREVDVRFVAATNRDLAELIRSGRFREDLYYRLNVAGIDIPALRERIEDILPLAQAFLREIALAVGVPVPRLGSGVTERLRAYAWPGNVRELRNVMERATILAEHGEIGITQLPREISGAAVVPGAEPDGAMVAPVLRSLTEVEREHIVRVLAHCEGNKTRAAEILGVTRLTLRNKLKQYALDDEA